MAFTIEVGSPWVLQECEVDLKYIENIKDFWSYEMPGKRFELQDIILIMYMFFFQVFQTIRCGYHRVFQLQEFWDELLFPQKALK